MTIKMILIGITTGICNGIFGSGGGTIIVPSLKTFLKYEDHNAHASAISVILPITMVSIFFYVKENYIDWNLAWQVSLGGVLGGLIGAKTLKKIPTQILRKIFGGLLIFAGMRMLIDVI